MLSASNNHLASEHEISSIHLVSEHSLAIAAIRNNCNLTPHASEQAEECVTCRCSADPSKMHGSARPTGKRVAELGAARTRKCTMLFGWAAHPSRFFQESWSSWKPSRRFQESGSSSSGLFLEAALAVSLAVAFSFVLAFS